MDRSIGLDFKFLETPPILHRKNHHQYFSGKCMQRLVILLVVAFLSTMTGPVGLLFFIYNYHMINVDWLVGVILREVVLVGTLSKS
jgi:hypothetical protein